MKDDFPQFINKITPLYLSGSSNILLLIVRKHCGKRQVVQYLEASGLSFNGETLLCSNDDVLALAFDNRGIFICGATVSDCLWTSPLLADVKLGCDTGGRCGTAYSTNAMPIHFTQLQVSRKMLFKILQFHVGGLWCDHLQGRTFSGTVLAEFRTWVHQQLM